jgi:nucleoside-specific outer membrane channel protein Tsx
MAPSCDLREREKPVDPRSFRLRMQALSVMATLGVLAATLWTSPGMASASVRGPNASGRAPTKAPAFGMTLSQAPTGLQAAVRATLRSPSGPSTVSGQQAELTASDGASGDDFGSSVAISGSTAVVGADTPNATGAAYVFVRSGTTWSQQAELTASDGASGDQFGHSVAISGSTAVVGEPYKNNGTGAAYVFVRSGTTWSQQAELTASDGTTDDFLGWSVAISGSTVVVGESTCCSATGAAYVFVRSGTTWSQQAELTASDGTFDDGFGHRVAISGDTVLVGALGKNSATGAAYVFVRSGTTWSQQAELTASDGASGDQFGSSVAISGSTAVVGAPIKKNTIGAAYVFVASGTTWSQQAELTASDGFGELFFGNSVAISGSTVVVGAPSSNGTGAAYVFVPSGTTWSQQAELTASDGVSGDFFGDSVAISGRTAVVGAPFKNSVTGAAYVFCRRSCSTIGA